MSDRWGGGGGGGGGEHYSPIYESKENKHQIFEYLRFMIHKRNLLGPGWGCWGKEVGEVGGGGAESNCPLDRLLEWLGWAQGGTH